MSPAAQLGFIVENIGGGEIVVIIFLALVVLGPERIPEMARSAGRTINNLKKLGTDMTGDMNDVMNDPAMQPIRELGEFAARPRQKLAEYALEAEAAERAKAAADSTPDDSSGDSDADLPAIADRALPPAVQDQEVEGLAAEVAAGESGSAAEAIAGETAAGESDPGPDDTSANSDDGLGSDDGLESPERSAGTDEAK